MTNSRDDSRKALESLVAQAYAKGYYHSKNQVLVAIAEVIKIHRKIANFENSDHTIACLEEIYKFVSILEV